MKKLNALCLFIIFYVPIICLESNLFSQDDLLRPLITVDSEQLNEKIVQADKVTQLQERVTQAEEKMNNACKELFERDNFKNDKENVKIIIQENFIIASAHYALKKIREMLAKDITDPGVKESYLNQLQDMGLEFWGNIKNLYSYTEEEKNIAVAVIDGLNAQIKKITDEYIIILQKLDVHLKQRFILRYEAIIQQFNVEIYKQKLIAGQVMSTNQQLVLGAVATAATAIGLALADKYINTAEVTPEQEPTIKLPDQDGDKDSMNVDFVKEEKKENLREDTHTVEIAPEPENKKIMEQRPTIELSDEREEDKESIVEINKEKIIGLPKQDDNKEIKELVKEEATKQEIENIDLRERVLKQVAAAQQQIKKAWFWSSTEGLNRLTVAEFIQDKLLIDPTDAKALEYLYKMEEADKKVAEREKEYNEFKEKIEREEILGSLSEQDAITKRLNTAKALQSAQLQDFISEIEKEKEDQAIKKLKGE